MGALQLMIRLSSGLLEVLLSSEDSERLDLSKIFEDYRNCMGPILTLILIPTEGSDAPTILGGLNLADFLPPQLYLELARIYRTYLRSSKSSWSLTMDTSSGKWISVRRNGLL